MTFLRRTKTAGTVFLFFVCSDISDTDSCHSCRTLYVFLLVYVMCFQDLSRNSIKSIQSIEESIATDSGVRHFIKQHPCPPNSDTTDECVHLNYGHGVQQALLC